MKLIQKFFHKPRDNQLDVFQRLEEIDAKLLDIINKFNWADSNSIDFARQHLLLQISQSTNSNAVANYFNRSKSQLQQDLFVISQLNSKRNGYFVEFGATNGISMSNTYLLEKEFGWTGILCEPARTWHDELIRNRSSIIETKCIWEKSGLTLMFNEIGDLSTLETYSGSDFHSDARKTGLSYPVETISLSDMLDQYEAPREIDYLSIDTEGSEFNILNSFDFSKYSFQIITCEHNYTESRSKICDLLISKGYKRVFVELSRFDDWYIRD